MIEAAVVQRFRECPSCRALLTEDQIAMSEGSCPYCKARLGPPRELARDDDDPLAEGPQPLEPLAVPGPLGAKIILAVEILFERLAVIAPLILMVKLPVNAIVEILVERQGLNMRHELGLHLLAELVFGPIYAAGLVAVLAHRMEGQPLALGDAARIGLDYWPRLFASRLVAWFQIACGMLAFIVPGLVLAVRYCFLDEVVVLENATVADSRSRSAMSTQGRGFRLFWAAFICSMLVNCFAGLVREGAIAGRLLDDPMTRAACMGVVDVVAVLVPIVLFLYYWETRPTWDEPAAAEELHEAASEGRP